MNNRILTSTGTMVGRVNNYNYKAVIERSPYIDCSGYEFMMLEAFYDKINTVVSDFIGAGLSVPVFHLDKKIGIYLSDCTEDALKSAMALFKINCSAAKELGAEKLVLHLWSGENSDKNISWNISAYSHFAEIAEKENLLLLTENIPCVYETPLKHLKNMKSVYKDAKFILDTRFASYHNEIDAFYESGWIEDGTISHMHISDFNGIRGGYYIRPILHPGEGVTDFERFFELFRNYNDTITLESPVMSEDGLDIEKLNKSLEYLKNKTSK